MNYALFAITVFLSIIVAYSDFTHSCVSVWLLVLHSVSIVLSLSTATSFYIYCLIAIIISFLVSIYTDQCDLLYMVIVCSLLLVNKVTFDDRLSFYVALLLILFFIRACKKESVQLAGYLSLISSVLLVNTVL